MHTLNYTNNLAPKKLMMACYCAVAKLNKKLYELAFNESLEYLNVKQRHTYNFTSV